MNLRTTAMMRLSHIYDKYDDRKQNRASKKVTGSHLFGSYFDCSLLPDVIILFKICDLVVDLLYCCAWCVIVLTEQVCVKLYYI